MRVAIGEFKQETNTFAWGVTTRQQFEDFHLWFGEEILANMRGTNSEVGGFISVCEERGLTLLPTLAGFAISGGPVTAETYLSLRNELLQRLDAARPFDAVLLALHGAMVAEGEDDPDGATLEAVRALIGPDTPLVVSMDLHANVTQKCVEQADVIVGFRTSPHIDQRETGERAARILADWLEGTVCPVMRHVKIPMVVSASTHIHFLPGPFQRLMEASLEAEQGEILSASVFTVQPWLDITEMGFATVVVADGRPESAERVAANLANQCWAERHALMDTQLVPPDEAISRALAHPTGPVVLSDLADGTGAGSPGDSTAAIEAMLRANPSKPAFLYVCDPEVAAEAQQIGVGGEIDTWVGGKRDNVYNRPVRFVGTIDYVQLSQFRFGGQGYTGMAMDMGLSAILRQGNVHLLVSSKPVMTVDPELYRAVGLEPAEAQIVVVKSHIQFRAGYKDIAKAIILLDSPGMSSDHLTSLNFQRIERPLFPFDPDLEWVAPEKKNLPT